MQRFFDILFSGLALVVLAPLLLPIALILRLTGEGEIFYRQTRVGLNGDLVPLFHDMVPEFAHKETGRYLDGRM